MFLALGTIFSCSLSATGLFLGSTKTEQINISTVLPVQSTLTSGDLIFRDGKSYISHTLKQFNLKDSRFSHAGIIHIEGGQTYVYHCIGGEGSSDNKMRRESLASFCAASEVNSYAIFRPVFDQNTVRAIDSTAGILFHKGIEFDTKFDLSSDDKMYCTEMIYKVFNSVLQENNFIPLTKVAGATYVSCDNIFLQEQMKPIYTHVYSRIL